MSVLSDKWIKKMSLENDMISPFEEKQIRGDSISFGLSSFGYDARVSDEFKIFTNVNSEIVDPKNFKPTNFVTKNTSECIIPPNSFVLRRGRRTNRESICLPSGSHISDSSRQPHGCSAIPHPTCPCSPV